MSKPVETMILPWNDYVRDPSVRGYKYTGEDDTMPPIIALRDKIKGGFRCGYWGYEDKNGVERKVIWDWSARQKGLI